MKKGWLVTLLFVVAGALFVASTDVTTDTATNPSLIVMPEHKKLPDFTFEMADNKVFNNDNLTGHWTLFFIGYTFCPDVCPTTLADLDRIYPALSKAPFDNIQIVFVSVDPNRDKANNLAEYVNYFNANFIGTTSEHKQLFPFAQDLGLVYSIVDEGDTDDAYYMVDHSASLVLVNPQGQHHATFKPVVNEQGVATVDMDLMTQDIHHLMQLSQ